MLMRWCCLLIIMIFGHARDIVYNVQFAMKKEREERERVVEQKKFDCQCRRHISDSMRGDENEQEQERDDDDEKTTSLFDFDS